VFQRDGGRITELVDVSVLLKLALGWLDGWGYYSTYKSVVVAVDDNEMVLGL